MVGTEQGQGARGTRAATAAGISLAAALATPAAAQAADFQVTKRTDTDGTCTLADCSLREAIKAANGSPGPDRILFRSGLSGTITLLGDLPGITESVEIRGPGPGTLTVSGINFAGENHGLLAVGHDFANGEDFPGQSLAVSGLTLASGSRVSGGGIFGLDADISVSDARIVGNRGGSAFHLGGGGIAAIGGTVAIAGSTISGNEAVADEAPLHGGGILLLNAEATIERSTISGNEAGGGGGGIFIASAGAMTIERSTISGNEAGGMGGGIFIASAGGTTIERSTISGNRALHGGGIASYSELSVRGTTISGNRAVAPEGSGAAAHGGGIDSYRSALAVESATVTANRADVGGGISSYESPGNPALGNSIVAGNAATAAGPDLRATGGDAFNSSFSLIGSTSGAAITNLGGSILNQPARLGPLADNGGPTRTHLPARTSPAVDRGLASGPDQRGLPRPVDLFAIPNAPGSNGADIGAVELQRDVGAFGRCVVAANRARQRAVRRASRIVRRARGASAKRAARRRAKRIRRRANMTRQRAVQACRARFL